MARAISLARAPRTGINRTVKLGAVLGSCAQWEIAQATPLNDIGGVTQEGKKGGEVAGKSLCSRNARLQKGLVRRAQVRLHQPPR